MGYRGSGLAQDCQVAIGIAEIHARALTPGAVPRHWAQLDRDAVALQVRDGLFGGAVPREAEVAVAGPHRIGGARLGRRSRAVHVQLLLADAVRVPAVRQLDELGAEHVAVERVRPLPVGDRDYNVVELRARHTLF